MSRSAVLESGGPPCWASCCPAWCRCSCRSRLRRRLSAPPTWCSPATSATTTPSPTSSTCSPTAADSPPAPDVEPIPAGTANRMGGRHQRSSQLPVPARADRVGHGVGDPPGKVVSHPRVIRPVDRCPLLQLLQDPVLDSGVAGVERLELLTSEPDHHRWHHGDQLCEWSNYLAHIGRAIWRYRSL